MLSGPQVRECVRFGNLLETRPGTFFEESVLSILVNGAPLNLALAALRVAKGLKNLAWWYSTEPSTPESVSAVLEIICTSNLQRLSLGFTVTFDHLMRLPPTSPLFRSLTHLDVAIGGEGLVQIQPLKSSILLTHLAIAFDNCAETDALHYVEEILQSCGERLRVFLITIFLEEGATTFRQLVQDSTIIVALGSLPNFRDDWEAFGRGEEDMWVCAEKALQEKLRRVVSPL